MGKGKAGKSKTVCSCCGVTEADIKRAIADGATTYKQVKKATGAGSKCGDCKDDVKKIIKRELAKMSEPEDKGDAVKKEEPSKKKDRFKFELEPLEGEFTVCKVQDPSAIDLSVPFTFVAKTDTELSLVCPTGKVPAETVAREDGWRALRVAGILEFSLIGVLEAITHDLAKRGVSCFAVSTYDTDYVLVKSEDFDRVFAEE